FCFFSQITNTRIDAYNNFKEGTTYLIKSGNNDFDTQMSSIFSNYWSINKYSVISKEEAKNLKGETSFFIDLFEYNYERTGVSLSYTIKKMILFKDFKITKKEIQPSGGLISAQIDEITLPELIYSIQLIQSQINFV